MAQRATGGEDWVLECAVSVVERWMGHRAVRGVVGGLLVGREGAVGVGRGRDADQRLQRQGVAQRATGGEEWVLECAVSVVERWMGHRAVRGVVGGLLVGREGAVGVGRGRDADQRLQRQGVAQRATGGEEWVLECAVSVVERWMGHRAVRGVVGGLLVGREGAVGVGRGRDADQRLQRQGVAQRATGGEEWVLECAVSVVERWMGHRAVRGVVGGLLVGREGAVGVGRGRDADQRLQRQGVAQRATGGEEWVLECAVSVVERWMGHRAVRGVVGGLLVGREGAVGVGRGRDADQRLQRQGAAQRATGGEE